MAELNNIFYIKTENYIMIYDMKKKFKLHCIIKEMFKDVSDIMMCFNNNIIYET
jgi:hypothetical protein